jgi:medium-chain acyl-[acyl-carrier-protein] hydrolase
MLHREDRFTVKAFDCRPDGRIKLNALMQYLQETAARHADQLGVGVADMGQRRCLWVLANLRIEIAREPRWTEDFTVKTWPSGYTRLVAAREFVGTAPDGSELFRAGSEWMVLDKQSSRPQNLTRLNLALPMDGPKALTTRLCRLKPAQQYVPAHTLRVPFSSLDFNGHVNNTEYVRWALDALHRNLGRLSGICAAQITYLAEAFEGDEIEVLVSSGDGGRFDILERRSRGSAGSDVCLMQILC